jgi:predicted lipoprotein with Yx(FWY)xxD motif
MRLGLLAPACAFLLLLGCGDDQASEPGSAATTESAAEPETPEAGRREAGGGSQGGGEREQEAGTEIVVGDSEYGEMLYDSKDQAIYIFENDGEDETVCYHECAEAWPPVLTDGDPEPGDGVDGSLLGTIERQDGTTQVTYAGQPLYSYAHEAPGEVRCHNVDLNGGFWWVVGPDGERLA